VFGLVKKEIKANAADFELPVAFGAVLVGFDNRSAILIRGRLFLGALTGDKKC
jgi:hypothetical protein